MKVITAAVAAIAMSYSVSVYGQTAMLAPVLVPAPETPTLKIGTKVPLKLSQELSTKGKQLRVGQHFQMETTEL